MFFFRSFLSSICIYFSWSVRYILSMPWKMTRPAVARAPVFGKRGSVNYMGGNGPPSPDVIRMMPGPIIDTPWQLHHQINVGRAVSRYKNIACIQQSVPSVPGSFYHSSNPLDSFWWIPVSQSGIEFPVLFFYYYYFLAVWSNWCQRAVDGWSSFGEGGEGRNFKVL